MEDFDLRSAVFERFIRPTLSNRKNKAGVEIEMPIVNLSKEPVDFGLVHEVTELFMKEFDMKSLKFDDDGFVTLAENSTNRDSISYDCSYNNLELSMGAEEDLNLVRDRFERYVRFLNAGFGEHGHMLTGMGINPHRRYNDNIPVPNPRYRMLYHHLHSFPKYRDLPMTFHRYPEFGTFASASQVQLDVNYEDLTAKLNIFSRLEPYKALLFSNSIFPEDRDGPVCMRDIFWENSSHGINPRNIGMYEKDFESPDEVVDYILSTSIYCVMKDDKYINFPPMPISEYFAAKTVKGEYFNPESGEYEEILFEPAPGDLEYLRTFKFEDLTFRGTIEYRSCCTQPLKETMTVAAFHKGLNEMTDELGRLLYEDGVLYKHGYDASELRKLIIRNKLPEGVDRETLKQTLISILDLASEGLARKGAREEIFLEPLYERAYSATNPALKMRKMIGDKIPMADIIREYSL